MATARERFQASPRSGIACSRSLGFWTLSPWGLGVRGTSFTKRMCRGILKERMGGAQPENDEARANAASSRAYLVELRVLA